jgi:predicted transcriptional regulator
MNKRTTTVRLPGELAEEVDIVARGKGVSVNALMVEALQSEIERVKADEEFMETLRALTERDKEILDRLAE